MYCLVYQLKKGCCRSAQGLLHVMHCLFKHCCRQQQTHPCSWCLIYCTSHHYERTCMTEIYQPYWDWHLKQSNFSGQYLQVQIKCCPLMASTLLSPLLMHVDRCCCGLQLLGFNCLRVPFSFTDLFTLTPRNFQGACTAATPDSVRADVTPPGLSSAASLTLPAQVSSMSASSCVNYWPSRCSAAWWMVA